MSGSEDPDFLTHRYHAPWTAKHPLPTVQQYKAHKAAENAEHSYESQNSSAPLREQTNEKDHGVNAKDDHIYKTESQPGDEQDHDLKDTSEAPSSVKEVQERRRKDDQNNGTHTERIVTDPVTHLPVTIHDFTKKDVKDVKEKIGKQDDQTHMHSQIEHIRHLLHSSPNTLDDKVIEQELQHQGTRQTFPDQDANSLSAQFEKKADRPFQFAGDIIAWMAIWLYGLSPNVTACSAWTLTKFTLIYTLFRGALYVGYFGFKKQKVRYWEDGIWEQRRLADLPNPATNKPESAIWFNQFISYVWPVVNPDVFASLVDTLEDVMQASLPRLVRMVSIEDLGQGSEPLRILGIRCLPRGAAAESVTVQGQVLDDQQETSDGNSSRKASKQSGKPGDQEMDQDKAAEDSDPNISAGLQAEEGEFVNLEIAFAYRPSASRRKFEDREKNAHLFLAFYLIAGIKLPVWVELEGLVGTMRLRLQLTPDPPFLALCTMTFLGQPKVDLACVPLIKRGLNIMDLPLISNFVQSAVDAAMSEYVAPKSLTLDLKSMLAGDDFKHDTNSRGVLVVRIIRAYGFKEGDMAIPLIRKGSSDGYVSVGWGKFGKILFSTRVIVEEMHPYFDETTFLVVGPQELDADEAVRLQLWDSDRMTADDDLGRIEVDLKELMNDKRSRCKMMERTDTFQAMRAGETMPGKLQWSVGYYHKARLLDSQVAHKPPKPNITTVEQLKEDSFNQSTRKLRESNRDEKLETDQLKIQDFEEKCTELITTSLPTQIYPSGILSVQIHQITGLKLVNQSRARDTDGGDGEDDEDEDGEHLPDSYVTISVNHQKVYKTRTKPKNSKPFFNAGTERFVRDWRTTTVFVTARDARVHEDNPLIGIVYIPIGQTLREKGASRFNEFFPLVGGIGYGRIRISVVFRSVDMQPLPQSLGWDWGTLEVGANVECDKSLPADLKSHKITFRTPLGKGKVYPTQGRFWASADESNDGHIGWTSRRNVPLRLPVRNRYSVPLVIEFRTHSLVHDRTIAFAVLWLQDIPDEEDLRVTIPVYKGDLARAEANVLPENEIGDKLGYLKVKLRFWRGLSRWHGRLGKKSGNVMDMMEVLQCAYDEALISELVGDDKWLAKRDGQANVPSANESSTDSSSDSENSSDDEKADDGNKESEDLKGKKLKRSNTSGFMNELRGYKRHKDQLHRRHRGVMQWKGPRIFQSMMNKAEHTVERMSDVFEHRSRQPGVETEI